MKPAIDQYDGVSAITKKEAIALADELFGGDAYKLWARGLKHRAEWLKHVSKYLKYRAMAEKLWTVTAKHRAEWLKHVSKYLKYRAMAEKLWRKLENQYRGYMPDYRAINFIAADREDGVYSFIWTWNEIWFYDGKNCPDPNTVEVIYKHEKATH